MATKSHGRCKICRAVIHSGHRFGMCAKHGREYYARLQRERQEAKARQRARQDTVLEEDHHMSEPEPKLSAGAARAQHARDVRDGKASARLNDEQRVEILDAYTTTDEPTDEIAARYGIKDTYIYNVLEKLDITWRRRDPISFETWQAQQHVEPEVPEPQQKALENMLDPDHVLKPRPEPVAPTPAVERRVHRPSNVDAEMWAITVQGVILMEGGDLEDAIHKVRVQQPGLRIIKVELSQ